MKTRFLLPAIALSLMTLTSCAGARWSLPRARPEAIGLDAHQLARIAPAMQAYVDSGKLAGVVAIVARHGQVGYARTFGMMDLESRKRMRWDGIFRIYSMTKPVLAVGVMKLVEQGKLQLDDPVARYIPGFANVQVYAGGTVDSMVLKAPDSVMTVRHLLTHTAGLSYGIGRSPVDSLVTRAQLYDPARTLEQFADSIARLPLLFSPGTAFNYSPAIDVVGRVIEVASGQPLDRFLEDHVFQPLGMRDTGFRIEPYMHDRLTTLYAQGEANELRKVTGGLLAMYEPEARFFWGGGGLLSTPDDYLRFAQVLLNQGELDGRRLLRPESVAEITRNQLPPNLTPLRGNPANGRYGQGLAGTVLVDTAGATMPGAPGIYRWSGYVGTYFWIDPVNDLVAMVWTQFTPGRTYELEEEFQRLVYSALK